MSSHLGIFFVLVCGRCCGYIYILWIYIHTQKKQKTVVRTGPRPNKKCSNVDGQMWVCVWKIHPAPPTRTTSLLLNYDLHMVLLLMGGRRWSVAQQSGWAVFGVCSGARRVRSRVRARASARSFHPCEPEQHTSTYSGWRRVPGGGRPGCVCVIFRRARAGSALPCGACMFARRPI